MNLRATIAGVLFGALAAQPGMAAAEAVLEEVIITAQKRDQRFQDVPVAVSSFDPVFLEQQNVQDFGELYLYTPGFSSSPNYSYHIYSSIRGISSTDFGFGTDPSIGFYLNGVHLGRYGTQVVSYYDIERVEVVKGPQNTLFGRSAIAGAIAVTTARPTQEFDAFVEVGAGNRDRVTATGMVNLPVSEALAFRIAGTIDDRAGYLKNTFGGSDIGASDVAAARLTGRLAPNDRLTADLILNYEDRKETGNVYAEVGLPDFTVNSSLRGRENRSDFEVMDATLDLRVGLTDAWELRSLTNYRTVEADYAEDYDGLAVIAGGPYYQGQDVDLFNQELRLQFESERGLSFIVGASYFDESMDAFVAEWVDTGLAFTGSPAPGLLPGDYSNAFIEKGFYDSGAKGYSFFADLSVPLTERVTVTAGARYNRDEKKLTLAIPDPAVLPENANAPFPCACYLYGAWLSTPLSLERSWDDTSVRLALDYDLTADVSTYVSWSQGWKAGGIESFKFALPPGFPLFFGLDLAAAGGNLRAYEPETVDSFEIGIKGFAADRRVQFDVVAYYFDFKDLQKSVFQGATAVIQNVGEADGRGIEADLRFRPNDNWTLFANAAYNDTEIKDDPNPAQVGQPLNRAPEFSGALGGTYSFTPGWAGGGNVALTASYAYQDEYRTDESLTPNVESYGIANASLAYTAASGRWSVRAYVDNLTDEFTYNRRLAPQLFVFPVETTSVLGKPREYGLTVRYNFGG